MIRPVVAMIYRELRRMVYQRDRLLSAMIRPLIWLLIIGSGFNSVLGAITEGGDYRLFLVPGLLSMTLLFGSILASLSLVYDTESGVMRMIVAAPFSHHWIIVARTVSATLVGLVQTLLLMIVLRLIGFWPGDVNLLWLVTGLIATSFLCASIGMLIATLSKTLDNFSVLMNFVIFPMFFLSGALYPISKLPEMLRFITFNNPFSYGVDLLKHAILGNRFPDVFSAEFSLSTDLWVLIVSGFSITLLSVLCFSQSAIKERLLRRIAHTRGQKR